MKILRTASVGPILLVLVKKSVNHKRNLFLCTAIDRLECFTIEGFPKTLLHAVITESNNTCENYKEGEECG